jgi:hypothetical protein
MEDLGDRQTRALDSLFRQAVEELEQPTKGWSIADGTLDKNEASNHVSQYRIENIKQLGKIIAEADSANRDAYKRVVTGQIVSYAFLICNPHVAEDQQLEKVINRKINAAVLIDIDLDNDVLSEGVITKAYGQGLGSPPIIEAIYALAELDPEVNQIRTRAIAAVSKLYLKGKEWASPDEAL